MRRLFRIGCSALLGGAALGLAACPSQNPPAATAPVPAAAPAAVAADPGLPTVEHQLGTTDFYLSLPPGFALKATDGADFLVYYFAPADTTVRADFSGGLYFGSQPQGDVANTTAGCQTRQTTLTVLGRPATWTIHRCATGYTLSNVFDSHSGRPWDAQLDAFGEAKSAAGLRQLLAVFATLRHRPGSAAPTATP